MLSSSGLPTRVLVTQTQSGQHASLHRHPCQASFTPSRCLQVAPKGSTFVTHLVVHRITQLIDFQCRTKPISDDPTRTLNINSATGQANSLGDRPTGLVFMTSDQMSTRTRTHCTHRTHRVSLMLEFDVAQINHRHIDTRQQAPTSETHQLLDMGCLVALRNGSTVRTLARVFCPNAPYDEKSF